MCDRSVDCGIEGMEFFVRELIVTQPKDSNPLSFQFFAHPNSLASVKTWTSELNASKSTHAIRTWGGQSRARKITSAQ